jgi:hypothetical protein
MNQHQRQAVLQMAETLRNVSKRFQDTSTIEDKASRLTVVEYLQENLQMSARIMQSESKLMTAIAENLELVVKLWE